MGGEEAPRTCKQNPGGKESGRVPVLLLPITSRAVGTWGYNGPSGGGGA